jgi:hypothetical protein
LPERLDKMRGCRWSARSKQPDLRDLLRLLRLGGKGKRQEHGAQSRPKNFFTHKV